MTDSSAGDSPVRKAGADFRWDGVEVMRYKEEGSAPFRDVTRQVLFDDPTLGCEWRYFEVAAGGWSTLERHEHTHAVMIARGRGSCLVGDRIHPVGPQDLVRISALTWHQFRAGDEPLGFLCLVNRQRDRPQLPSADDLAAMRRDPRIAEFIRA